MKTTVLNALIDFRDNPDKDPQKGVCWHMLRVLNSQQAKFYFLDLMSNNQNDFEYYSGATMYPISPIGCFCSGDIGFTPHSSYSYARSNATMYKGEYGRRRLLFVDFLINRLIGDECDGETNEP